MGDLQAAEPLLENPKAPPQLRAMYLMFQRRYTAAIEILSSALANRTDRNIRNPMEIIELGLNLGLSQQRAGDVSAARTTYQRAVQDLQRQLEKVTPGSGDADAHGSLGLAYAGLGEAASAIAEGQKAMAILPTSKDPEGGPEEEATMANIYALLGMPIMRFPFSNGCCKHHTAVRRCSLRRRCDSIRLGCNPRRSAFSSIGGRNGAVARKIDRSAIRLKT